MKASTQKLLNQVEQAHDWTRGQVFGGTGTRLSSECQCRACGLQRHWFSDRQNDVEDDYTFFAENDSPLSLRAAVAKGCN